MEKRRNPQLMSWTVLLKCSLFCRWVISSAPAQSLWNLLPSQRWGSDQSVHDLTMLRALQAWLSCRTAAFPVMCGLLDQTTRISYPNWLESEAQPLSYSRFQEIFHKTFLKTSLCRVSYNWISATLVIFHSVRHQFILAVRLTPANLFIKLPANTLSNNSEIAQASQTKAFWTWHTELHNRKQDFLLFPKPEMHQENVCRAAQLPPVLPGQLLAGEKALTCCRAPSLSQWSPGRARRHQLLQMTSSHPLGSDQHRWLQYHQRSLKKTGMCQLLPYRKQGAVSASWRLPVSDLPHMDIK